MKIAGQRCERGIVGEPFKEFADISDPKRALEAGANLAQSFGKIQKWFLNRLCNSSADNPATRITFLRLLSPDAMVTEERGTFKRFARNSTQAAFALPSTGGAVKDSLSAPPSSPVMAFFRARGWSLIAKVTPAGPSVIENMQNRSTTEDSEDTEETRPLCFSVSSVVSAFPLSGGAVNDSFSASPSSPDRLRLRTCKSIYHGGHRGH